MSITGRILPQILTKAANPAMFKFCNQIDVSGETPVISKLHGHVYSEYDENE
jgi:hypothetical protein